MRVEAQRTRFRKLPDVITFDIKDYTFVAKVAGSRRATADTKFVHKLQYISGGDGEEWVLLDVRRKVLSDDHGHENVPYFLHPCDSTRKVKSAAMHMDNSEVTTPVKTGHQTPKPTKVAESKQLEVVKPELTLKSRLLEYESRLLVNIRPPWRSENGIEEQPSAGQPNLNSKYRLMPLKRKRAPDDQDEMERGSKARLLAEDKICWNFVRGKCYLGRRCRFMHLNDNEAKAAAKRSMMRAGKAFMVGNNSEAASQLESLTGSWI